MKTWWDDLHSCSAAMDDYKLFSRERQERRGDGAALYVRAFLDCLEIHDSDYKAGCLWVRFRVKASKTSVMVERSRSVADQPTRRKRQTKCNMSSWKKCHNCQLLFSWGTYVCCKYNTAEKKEFKRFLEPMEENLWHGGDRVGTIPTRPRKSWAT